MATVLLDDTDPVDAVAIAYHRELKAAEAEGNFYGYTQSKAVWQDSKLADDFLTTERRHRGQVAKSAGKP